MITTNSSVNMTQLQTLLISENICGCARKSNRNTIATQAMLELALKNQSAKRLSLFLVVSVT